MPGFNHYSWCTCGWCQKRSRFNNRSVHTRRLAQPWRPGRRGLSSYVVPNACCPVCGAFVYFYQSANGGRVFFDELGPPWPKHPCTDSRAPSYSPSRGISYARRTKWQIDGWVPVIGPTITKKIDGWSHVKTVREDSLETVSGLLLYPKTLPVNTPFLAKQKDRFGIGSLSWIEDDGVPNTSLFVDELLSCSTADLLARALADDRDAVLLLASRIHRFQHEPEWVHCERVQSEQRAAIRYAWYEKAAKYTYEYDGILASLQREYPSLPERMEFSDRADESVTPQIEVAWYKIFTKDFDEEVYPLARQLPAIASDVSSQMRELPQKEVSPLDGCLVSLLIDCSGSLGEPFLRVLPKKLAELAAVVVKSGALLEILGYTTVQWRGGRSRDLWTASGRPANPGRLNDLRHIVFKEWSEICTEADLLARLALLQDAQIRKENIDGEALAWAFGRSTRAPAKHLCIAMITDGGPIDEATLSANPADYLSRHLSEILLKIHEASAASVVMIRLGDTLSPFSGQHVIWHLGKERDWVGSGWKLIIKGLEDHWRRVSHE